MNKKIVTISIIILVVVAIAGGFWYASNSQKSNVESQKPVEQNDVIPEKLGIREEQKNKEYTIKHTPNGDVAYFEDDSKKDTNTPSEKNTPVKIKYNDKITEEFKLNANGKDMSDWNTYKNNKYGFEVKYPKNWRVDEDKKGNGDVLTSILFSAPGDFPGGGTWGILILKDRDLENVLVDKVRKIDKQCGNVKKNVIWTKFKRDVNVVFIDVLEDYCDKQDWGISSIFFKNNNNLFIINNANEDNVNFKFTN